MQEKRSIHDGNPRSHRPAQAVCDRPAGDRRRQFCRAGRRDRGAARPLRLRQDHDAALRRGAGASDLGRDQHRRPGGLVARARHAGAAAPARTRHGVSVLCGVAAYDGAAERGLSAQAPQIVAQPTPAARSTKRSNWSACRNMPNGRWWRCPAARCSAWRWRAASSTGRNCCCSTSRCRTSTPSCACGCATICASSSSRPAMTALYVTHDQAEAVVLGDRIGVMRDGKLLQMDTPDAIYNRPADLFVANFTGATNELAGTLVSRNGEFGTVDFGEGRRGEVALAAFARPGREGARSRCGRRTSPSASITAPTSFPPASSTAAIRARRPPTASNCSAGGWRWSNSAPRPGIRSASRPRFRCRRKVAGPIATPGRWRMNEAARAAANVAAGGCELRSMRRAN